LVILVTSSVANATIPTSERNALIALYLSTEGWDWNYDSGWLGPVGTECDWYRVTCDSTESHVEQLWLYNNSLGGTLPSDLGNLPNLLYLDLTSNHISGSIPVELGDLSNLEDLYLDDNWLTGSIPPELGNLSSLQGLGLADNLLTGEIPPGIADIQSLEYLSVGDNRLSGQIPPAFGYLPNLDALNLTSNKLTGEIPATFMNLTVPCSNRSLRIEYNGLYTSNPALEAFLDSCLIDWRRQAWPPSDPYVIDLSGRLARIGWTPIEWATFGAYEVLTSTSSGGPYTRIPSTAIYRGMGGDDVIIGPLEPDTTYYVVARSITFEHKYTLASRLSEELIFTTPPSTDYYVSTTGNDMNSCLTPAAPCRHVQSAIDRADDGDAVVIAPGTYSENLSIGKSLVIEGSPMSPAVIDGHQSGSTVFVDSGLRVALQNLWIMNGDADEGGGVFNLGSYLFVLNSEVTGNSALFEGGGLYNYEGMLVVENATIANNTAHDGAAVEGSASFWNSTLTGNTSTGIFSQVIRDSGGRLWNCTVTGNRAGDSGYVMYSLDRSQHTIIADNFSQNCYSWEGNTYGHNVDDTDSCLYASSMIVNGDQPLTEPLLGPLAANGGLTRTHALLVGSPAIDAGDNEGAPLIDQRGGERPVDGDLDGDPVIDSGAYEYGASVENVIFETGFESGDTWDWSVTIGVR